MRASRPASLAGRVRAAAYEAVLDEIRAVAGEGCRALVAAGPAEWMPVVAATGTSPDSLEGSGIALFSLSPALRDSLIGGSPVETDELDEALPAGAGLGRAFVCPVVTGERPGGLLAVEAAGLAPEGREALTALAEELAPLLRDTARPGEPHHPADFERLQALVQDVSEIVTVMEADGSVRYVSPSVERVMGYTREEYVGRSAFAHVHPSDMERVSGSFFASREGPDARDSTETRSGHIEEFRVRHADGSWRLMQITARDLLDDPEVGAMVVTSRDVTAERLKERELRESEERLQTVFRQATEGMYLVEIDTRRILEANAALRELLDYTAEELCGMTIYDIVDHDRESIDANLQRVVEGIHHIGERRYRRRDGSLVDVSASVSLVSYRGRLVINVIARDVGERKRAEEALQRSEERFRVLVEQAADALFVHDPDGRLVDANRRACESLGYTKDELLALSVQDIERNVESAMLKELWRRLGVEGSARLDGVHRRKDGTTFPVELHIRRLQVEGRQLMLAAARDVTERRRMEEALRESEASLARAQQVARLGSWEAKTPGDGDPGEESRVLWSDEMYRIFGYSPRRFVPGPETIAEATHPRDRPRVRRRIEEAVSRGDPFLSVEHRIVRPDGELRNVLARIELIYGASGEPTGQFGTLLDVTERKQVEEKLRKSESRLSEAQRLARVGSWEYDVARDRVLWSDEMYRIFGHEPQSFELSFRAFLRSVHPDDRALIKRKIRRAAYDRSGSLEYRVIRPDGEERCVQARYELSYDRESQTLHMIGALQDITERKAMERQLSHQAFHDTLTGLPNRALFQDRLERALSRPGRAEITLLFLDLDNFKDVNDTLGHEAGDEVLVRVGERLRGCLRSADTVARFGGDEFIVLLEESSGLDGAREVAERITASLRAPFSALGQEILLTTSIGIVQSGPGRESAVELLRDADVALYRAKDEGRAGYEVFDSAMSLKARERLNLVAELHRAVESEQFVLHYQPVVDLVSGETFGAEALLRWEHPARGTIFPTEFIPVAEETGLIRPIGRWVLREACRQLGEWRRSRRGPSTVSVNLSARQFRQPGLAREIKEVLARDGLEPGALVLEITESTLVWDVESTVETLRSLKDLGVQISIDDFGTGYSNLAYLARLPVDELKIDRSFVQRLDEATDDMTIVRAVVDLADSLGLKVIAEGVETAAQAERLRELGCGRVQGYYFARPRSAEEL